MFGVLRKRRMRRVLVILWDDTSVSGVLRHSGRDGLLIDAPTIVTEDQQAPAGGSIFVPAANVRFVQVDLPGSV